MNANAVKTILITGGAGFIGAHLCHLMVEKYPQYRILNLDALTYAANLQHISTLDASPNYTFVKGNILDTDLLNRLFSENQIDGVIHLAAESHVDRSIEDPLAFARTNILGTINLLDQCVRHWKNNTDKRFYHISTDEVYGSLGPEGHFTEESPYRPNSPYSASKASSDHFVRAYGETYGLPFVISNCSNNYGPYQYPEKLIPVCIKQALELRPIPVYGDGKYTRDWLYAGDHAEAIDLVFHQGRNGETYNIGSNNEWQNIDLVQKICRIIDAKLNRPEGQTAQLIQFVKDRPGHDKRYAIDASKMKTELGWIAKTRFDEGLERTIDWYLSNLPKG